MMVASPLPRWAGLAADPPVVFLGGPVSHDSVICLARATGHPSSGGGEGWQAVTDTVATVDLSLDPEVVSERLGKVRVFAGYAGWGSGQLESELEAGAWWVVEASPGDAFSDDPDRLWSAVLRRQPNALALVSYFPHDVTAN